MKHFQNPLREGLRLQRTPEAYERLLLDGMLGDATLFTRADEVETAWARIMPILAD